MARAVTRRSRVRISPPLCTNPATADWRSRGFRPVDEVAGERGAQFQLAPWLVVAHVNVEGVEQLGRLDRPAPRPTSECARTGSTQAAPSPCATTAGCITSASAEPTRARRSSSSWPTSTSGSCSPRPGELIRQLTLDPSRDYQRSGGGLDVYDVSGHLSPMSRGTAEAEGVGFEPTSRLATATGFQDHRWSFRRRTPSAIRRGVIFGGFEGERRATASCGMLPFYAKIQSRDSCRD